MTSFPKTTPVRLKGGAMHKFRVEIFLRDKGKCVHVDEGQICGRFVSFDGKDGLPPMHLAHRRNKRMWGDTAENVFACCPRCHLVLIHNPKSVPAKERRKRA